MDLSRRDFLKLSGLTTGGVLLPRNVAAATKGAGPLKARKAIGETPTICPFCAVGCGLIVAAEGNRVVNIEGDPDHPVNQGSLCSKGMGLAQLNTVDGEVNQRRLQKVRYRAAGASSRRSGHLRASLRPGGGSHPNRLARFDDRRPFHPGQRGGGGFFRFY